MLRVTKHVASQFVFAPGKRWLALAPGQIPSPSPETKLLSYMLPGSVAALSVP